MFSKLECCASVVHTYIFHVRRALRCADGSTRGRRPGEAGGGRGRPVAGEGRDGHVLHATLGAPLHASLGAEQQREAELQRDQPQDRKEVDLARLLALLLALARLAVVPRRRL